MLINTLYQTLTITSFVFVMMLIIEYINIQTQGLWRKSIIESRWKQYIIGALLGISPGCLGAFTAVALFSHGILSFGAVVAAMIATSGDEAFVMFAMIPDKALLLTGIIFIVGIIAGYLTDKFFKFKGGEKKLELHGRDVCNCFPKGQIIDQLKQMTLQRAVLILMIVVFIFELMSGGFGMQIWNWKKITFVIINLISLFIVMTVPEHFLEEHLWKHIVKKHVPQIFFWTYGALLIMNLLTRYFDFTGWISSNQFIILIIAALIGLIPESGPHLVFVTLFANGIISFPVLLASSIVQDGHGMLPMLAESRKHFIYIKLINLAAGLIVGFSGLLILKII